MADASVWTTQSPTVLMPRLQGNTWAIDAQLGTLGTTGTAVATENTIVSLAASIGVVATETEEIAIVITTEGTLAIGVSVVVLRHPGGDTLPSIGAVGVTLAALLVVAVLLLPVPAPGTTTRLLLQSMLVGRKIPSRLRSFQPMATDENGTKRFQFQGWFYRGTVSSSLKLFTHILQKKTGTLFNSLQTLSLQNKLSSFRRLSSSLKFCSSYRLLSMFLPPSSSSFSLSSRLINSIFISSY